MSDRTLPSCILRATVDGYERLYSAATDVAERLTLWRKQARIKAEIGRREWRNEEQAKAYARHLLEQGVRP